MGQKEIGIKAQINTKVSTRSSIKNKVRQSIPAQCQNLIKNKNLKAVFLDFKFIRKTAFLCETVIFFVKQLFFCRLFGI